MSVTDDVVVPATATVLLFSDALI
ncbi:transporter, partial [Salmonella enterica]|nr:transporter [Salmonella enterica]